MAAITLDTYKVALQRLLHDTGGNYFNSGQLADYINQARTKLSIDSNCVRALQTLTLVAGTEVYPFSGFTKGTSTINLLSGSVLFGALKYPLRRVSFDFLTAHTRAFVGYKQMPVLFAIYGENSVYVGPMPDQPYTVECNTAIMTDDLTDASPAEVQVPVAYSAVVPYYAAFLAKQFQQMWNDAAMFEADYDRKLRQMRSGVTGRIVGDIYTARS